MRIPLIYLNAIAVIVNIACLMAFDGDHWNAVAAAVGIVSIVGLQIMKD